MAKAHRGLLGSRFLRVALLLVAIAACGYGIWWLWQFSRATGVRVLLVSVPEYQNAAIPPNPQSAHDRELIQLLTGLDHKLQPVNIGELDSFNAPPPTGRQREVLVLTVSLLAGSDGQGLYFLPRDADPDAPEKFLRADALWDWLKELPNERQPKLLLLDLGRVRTDWRNGWFAPSLWSEMQNRASEVPGLVILTSCSPGERSWASADLGPGGGSAFLHFAAKGLLGEADLDRDSQVHVSELYRYVASNTAHWVVSNRDEIRSQHVQLFPSERQLGPKDFVITRVLGSPGDVARSAAQKIQEQSDAAAAERRGVEQSIGRAWESRDRLLNREGPVRPWESAPVHWQLIHEWLMAAETALDAGLPNRATTLVRRVDKLVAEVEQRFSPPEAELSDVPFLRDNVGRRWQDRRNQQTGGAAKDVSGTPSAVEPFLRPEDVLKRHLENGGQPSGIPHEIAPQLIGQAVALRALAEQAATPTPRAMRWVGKRLLAADNELRTLEDSLFSGAPPAADDPAFANLRQQYQQLLALGQAVETAEGTLARARAKLSGLARWAARRSSDVSVRERLIQLAVQEPSSFLPQRSKEFLGKLEQLAGSAQDLLGAEYLVAALIGHTARLQASLSEESPGSLQGDDVEKAIESLTTLAGRVGDLETTIHTKLIVEAEEVRKLSPESPQPLHRRRVVDCLRYPGLPAGLRADLRKKLRDFERAMHDHTTPVATGEILATLEEASAEQGRTDVAQGIWHAFWVLQLSALRDPIQSAEFQAQQLERDWRAAAAGDDVGGQRELLVKVGERIRRSWPAARRHVEELMSRSAEFEPRRHLLVAAERAAVFLDSYDAESMLEGWGEPSDLLRDYNLIDEVLVQAQRHLDGFWIDRADLSSSSAWYRKVVEQCLSFAEQRARLAEQRSRAARIEMQPIAAGIRNLLRERAAAQLQLTSPEDSTIRFSLAGSRLPVAIKTGPQGSLPAGSAAVWMNLSDRDRLTVESNGQPVPTDSASAVQLMLERPGVASTAGDACEQIRGETVAFFRGHVWRSGSLLEVEPCRAPGRITTYTPATDTGGVVLNGRDQRPIMFVLDCSGSMNELVPDDPQGRTKFAVARANLKRLIQGLANDDRAGLVLFGHRVGFARPPENRKTNPNWESKFGPIPQALGYIDDFDVYVRIGPLAQTKKQMLDLIDMLEQTGAFGNTPLLGAINKGLDQLPPTGGIVVAITDGEADDQTQQEGPLKGRLTRIPAKVEVVGFGFVAKTPEGAAAKKQLEGLAGRLENLAFRNAPGDVELRESLEDALKPRQYQVARLRSATPPTAAELGSITSGLTLGSYQLTFPEYPPVQFTIKGGELIELALDPTYRRIVRPDPTYNLPQSIVRPELATKDDPHLMAYESFSIDQDGDATLTVVLDRRPDWDEQANAARLVQRPRQVQFEVTAEGTDWKGDISWGVLKDQSVPTWELVLNDWPTGQPAAIVRGWWRRELAPPNAVIDWSNLKAAYSPETAREIELVGEPLRLKVYATRPTPTRLQLAVTFPEGVPVSPESIAVLEDLDVKLGLVDANGVFGPYDLASKRDFGASDGSLLVEFDIAGVDLERSSVALTTAKTIRDGALTTDPIRITRVNKAGTGN